jgi:hypothetical protein
VKFSKTHLFICCFVFVLKANSQLVTNSQLWLTYQFTPSFNNKWGGWMDFNYRRQGSFVEENFQQALRMGLTFKLKKNQSVTGGYAYFKHFRPRTGFDEVLVENRLWSQYLLTNQKGKRQHAHRIRFEMRNMELSPNQALFNKDDIQTFYRFRYQWQIRFPITNLTKSKHPFWIVGSEEIMFHAGELIEQNYFDQNRAFLGLEWKAVENMHIVGGYMHLIQFQPVQDRWRQSHVFRITLRHTPDWTKKE